MIAQEPIQSAARTLLAALGLYGRNVVPLTLLSLVPALARVALFLQLPWLSGAWPGIMEAVVGIFRLALFYVAFRLVWPEGLAGLQVGAGSPWKIRIARPEIFWQLVLLAAVPLVLNLAAAFIARSVTPQPRLEAAINFALKNLLVIPLWMVQLLVVIRRVLQG